MILIFGTHLQYLYKSTHEDHDFHPAKRSPAIWIEKTKLSIKYQLWYITEIFEVIKFIVLK